MGNGFPYSHPNTQRPLAWGPRSLTPRTKTYSWGPRGRLLLDLGRYVCDSARACGSKVRAFGAVSIPDLKVAASTGPRWREARGSLARIRSFPPLRLRSGQALRAMKLRVGWGTRRWSCRRCGG